MVESCKVYCWISAVSTYHTFTVTLGIVVASIQCQYSDDLKSHEKPLVGQLRLDLMGNNLTYYIMMFRIQPSHFSSVGRAHD
jgi:hypothetical protein